MVAVYVTICTYVSRYLLYILWYFYLFYDTIKIFNEYLNISLLALEMYEFIAHLKTVVTCLVGIKNGFEFGLFLMNGTYWL